jgi:hypothetical protein
MMLMMLMMIGHPFWECFGSALGLLFLVQTNIILMVISKVQTVSNAGHYLKLTAFGDVLTIKCMMLMMLIMLIMLMVIGHPFWECFGSALGLLFFNGANQHHLF